MADAPARRTPSPALAAGGGARRAALPMSFVKKAALGAAFLLAALAGSVAVAEWRGWPFLADPLARLASQHLQRPLQLDAAGTGGAGGTVAPAADTPRFHLRLIGGVRLDVARLTLGNPDWSALGPMLVADQVHLHLRWRDLWAARGGQPLRVQALTAQTLQLALERAADGRASWQFGSPEAPPAQTGRGIDGVVPVRLDIARADVRLRDAVHRLDLSGQVTRSRPPGWLVQAQGRYQGQPLRLRLQAGPGLTDQALGDRAAAVPMTLSLQAGRARLQVEGRLQDPAGARVLDGRFELAGPSLAAVGEPLGVTLPTTAAFSMDGAIRHQAGRWQAAITQARVGRSELAGDFVFDTTAGPRPMLEGELRGRALWLQDLGPAIGTEPPAAEAGTAQRDTSAGPSGRVLPDRRFDLPSLQAMQADVRVALDRLELGHAKLQSLRPVRARLTLDDGRLALTDLDARLAQGRIAGQVLLDGSVRPARWDVDLRAQALPIEQWISQPRGADGKGQPPYVAGQLSGRVQLRGRGASTAELLAGSDGQAWLVVREGQVSHLALEAAGLDLAQALGVMLRGDDALPVQCAVADLRVNDGVVRPAVLVLDTADSTLWAEGRLSLADEKLDLVARVAPHDFSPLALRAPLHLRGMLGAPEVSIDKRRLAGRLAPAALLALVHPLAGLLPLLDRGDDEAAAPAVAACRQVLQQRGRPAAGKGVPAAKAASGVGIVRQQVQPTT